MTNRNQIKIFYDILTIIELKPIQLTHILYKSNMSYVQFKLYMKRLLNGKFITVDKRLIDITVDGIELRELLKRLNNIPVNCIELDELTKRLIGKGSG